MRSCLLLFGFAGSNCSFCVKSKLEPSASRSLLPPSIAISNQNLVLVPRLSILTGPQAIFPTLKAFSLV
ncbi:hypothetical protein Agabi119p4_8486 [Agaricus bisporus var. burnettii]|uniref:Uncharacterized protein n=1 Tax=Agaricus bisporus var. burnettii TaxID=192524 RepID=A0A8H7EZ13_AGABI|nr:hypothetical protein Agabi119p4_8486 [Agaricus bisporus var. burnettii]